jgi:hypothetical protein
MVTGVRSVAASPQPDEGGARSAGDGSSDASSSRSSSLSRSHEALKLALSRLIAIKALVSVLLKQWKK